MDNIAQMDDPEFLAERRRVREELAVRPTVELTVRYQALNAEFDRRASAAWEVAR